MAAPSSNSIRVRLYFDYPPPAVSECRMCWVLVDLNKCRVVADLESIVRDKFDFGHKSILNLFIEDCYLPHTESIFVVRDNDSIRVKVDSVVHVNGCSRKPETTREKKRLRHASEDEQAAENGLSLERKKKKRKKEKCSEKQDEEAFSDKSTTDTQRKLAKKKKKKQQKDSQENCSTSKPKTKVTTVGQTTKSTRGPADQPIAKQVNGKTKAQDVFSSSSSESSENDDAPKKTHTEPGPKKPHTLPAPSSVPPNHSAPKSQPAPSSSSDTDSSSDEAPIMSAQKINLKPIAPPTPKAVSGSKNTPSSSQPTSCAQNKASGSRETLPAHKASGQPEHSSDSDSSSEEEIRLVIKKPLQGQGLGMGVAPPRDVPTPRDTHPDEPAGRSGGRGARGARGRGAAVRYNYDSGSPREQMSYHGDLLTNTSVVLQVCNSTPPAVIDHMEIGLQSQVEVAPKRDYSSLPLLAAPPPVGQKIAFKLLELTENYSPEVSEYKEGKVVSFDPTTQQIELELLNVTHAPVEPGKFDLVYEDVDGSERVEYAVSRGSSVAERWDSLLEPRLVM